MLLTTANIRNRPPMRTRFVRADVALAKRHSTIIGWQEINPPRYKSAIKTAGDGHWAHAQLDTPIPISVAADYYRIVISGRRRTHGGKATASPARWITWAQVEDRRTGARFIVLNTHFVSGAWNRKPKTFKGWRQRMWDQHWAVLVELVAGFHDAGHTVLITGDFNRAQLPGDLHVAARVLTGGIDKLILVPASHRVRFRSLHTRQGRSDHAQRTARLRLARVLTLQPD